MHTVTCTRTLIHPHTLSCIFYCIFVCWSCLFIFSCHCNCKICKQIFNSNINWQWQQQQQSNKGCEVSTTQFFCYCTKIVLRDFKNAFNARCSNWCGLHCETFFNCMLLCNNFRITYVIDHRDVNLRLFKN